MKALHRAVCDIVTQTALALPAPSQLRQMQTRYSNEARTVGFYSITFAHLTLRYYEEQTPIT